MLRELEIADADLARVQDAMGPLRDTEDVLVIRGGALRFPKERWIEILEGQLGLIPDRRHFTPKWAADDGRRLERRARYDSNQDNDRSPKTENRGIKPMAADNRAWIT
jgi:hypothetical protein